MEKKIVFSKTMPDKRFLWLHTKNNNLVLEVFGNKGWEAIGNDSVADMVNKLVTENQQFRKPLKAQTPIQVKFPKLTEDCSKKELLEVISSLIDSLVQANVIKV